MEIKELVEKNKENNEDPLKTAVEHLMKVKGWGLASEKDFMEYSIQLQDFVEEANFIVESIKHEKAN